MPAPKRPANPDQPKPAPAKAARVVVTYDGPTDPKDGTTRVVVDDERFPLGQPVETTKSTAQRLASMAGHTFNIEPARPEGGM